MKASAAGATTMPTPPCPRVCKLREEQWRWRSISDRTSNAMTATPTSAGSLRLIDRLEVSDDDRGQASEAGGVLLSCLPFTYQMTRGGRLFALPPLSLAVAFNTFIASAYLWNHRSIAKQLTTF